LLRAKGRAFLVVLRARGSLRKFMLAFPPLRACGLATGSHSRCQLPSNESIQIPQEFSTDMSVAFVVPLRVERSWLHKKKIYIWICIEDLNFRSKIWPLSLVVRFFDSG
jgi:hypothetical protein